MDEWTPSDEQYDIVMAFALQNVIEYDGKPEAGSIMKRIMTNQPKMRQFARYLNPIINETMADAITMYEQDGREMSLEYLGELGLIGEGMLDRFQEMEGPKIKREQVLKDLPNAEVGNFRVRFAPNPNAPLTIGHSRGVTINSAYADKYDGELIIRFDDTGMGTKPPLLEAYDLIPEDVEWLTGRTRDEYTIHYASSRLNLYYDWAEELIRLGGAYVDTLSRDESAELKAQGLPNPYRSRTVGENLLLFNQMIDGEFQPGEAVLRIKSDPNAPDPAMRDFILFRMQVGGHPLQPDATCWPLLDFQSAIDDHDLDITHIIRGSDLQASTRKQQILYDIFGWEYPEVEYWGKVKILEEVIDPVTNRPMRNEEDEIVYQPISFSSSAYARGIKEGVYEGWDDPRLYTVQGMRARGYSPEAITQWWKDMGMTRRDIKAPLSSLDALNRDTSTKRAETFESDEVIDPFYDSDCLICARPFGDGFGMWASRIRFEEVETAYYAAVKDAKRDAYTDLMNQRMSGDLIMTQDEDSWKVFRDDYLSDEERDEIEYTATYTLKSKKNPYGVRKTARTLPYWWLMQIPVTYPDGTEELGHGLDALNAYMAQYLIEGKKESSLAKQVEAYLREILVVPDKIGGQVMDIQDFGLNPPNRRIPAYSSRFIDEFEANGVSADPPPPPRSNKDGSCVICGRDFIFSPLAQSLSITYAQKSDGGAVDMKSSKTMPEDASISRTAVHIAGKYLFTYQGSALDEYFKQTKSPSQKVINLLRLALVPGITANREMFQLLKGLEFQEEAPIQFPSNFIDEFGAERLEIVHGEYAPTERIIQRLKDSGVWELGETYDSEGLQYIWWATVKIEDGTLVPASLEEDFLAEDLINLVLLIDNRRDRPKLGRLAVSIADMDNAEFGDREWDEELYQLGKELTIVFQNNGMFQSDDDLEYGDMGEFYNVVWGDLVNHSCADNAKFDIYEEDEGEGLITMECMNCGRTAIFRQENPYEGPRNAETFEAHYSCSDCVNDGDYGAESVLASVKSAETIDQAQAVLSNYSGQGMMAENLQYLNSIISYDYGSGKNAEFEVYGAPTLQDVQKFAEGLVNIQRFLGE
jgi:glutamyl-tRNA synthetase